MQDCIEMCIALQGKPYGDIFTNFAKHEGHDEIRCLESKSCVVINLFKTQYFSSGNHKSI